MTPLTRSLTQPEPFAAIQKIVQMDRDCIFVERTGLGPVGDRHLARLNFSIIKVGLVSFDPYLLAAIRFVLCALPSIFFFPRPTVKWGFLVAYGVMFGVLQWGLVYAGIYFGLSAGLASLVLQLAVFSPWRA